MEDLETLLNDMKKEGIGAAVIRNDGVTVSSTIALNDVASGVLSSLANVSDAMLKRSGDKQESIEIAYKNEIVVVVPIKNHIFCGVIKDRSEKNKVLEFAKKAESFL